MMHVSMSLEPLLLKPYMSEQEECGKGANRDLAFLIHKTKSSIQTCYKKKQTELVSWGSERTIAYRMYRRTKGQRKSL